MEFLKITSLVMVGIYFLLHIYLILKLKFAIEKDKNEESELLNLSVIVASHNEEKNIENCLRSILENIYQKNKFEVILVDDRSSDSTFEIVNKLKSEFGNLKYFKVDGTETGNTFKKNAIEFGIKNSENEHLCFTDADSIVPKNWLSEISNKFAEGADVVFGYSPYKIETNKNLNLLNSFLDYEEYKNSLYGFSFSEIKMSYLCSGRNFAYKKSIFNLVGGFSKIKNFLSGDDDLLLQIFMKNKANIIPLLNSNSFVETNYPENFKHFFMQRMRHFSVSYFYPLPLKLFYSFLHLTNLLLIYFAFYDINYFLILYAIKFIGDYSFVNLVSVNFNFNQNKISELLNEILFDLYFIFFGIMSLIRALKVSDNLKWK